MIMSTARSSTLLASWCAMVLGVSPVCSAALIAGTASTIAHQEASNVLDLAVDMINHGGPEHGSRGLMEMYSTLITCLLCQVRLTLGDDIAMLMSQQCAKAAIELDMTKLRGLH